jgi:hypothetical protein
MKVLELAAAEVFRRVSNLVKGTPIDMKVNPYTISLTEAVDTESPMALERDAAIAKDIAKMWFYTPPQPSPKGREVQHN